MGTKIVIFTAIIACVVAYLYLYDDHRMKIWKLINTCPLHWFSSPGSKLGGGRLDFVRLETDVIMTKEELSKYTGEEGSPGLYLACLGRIYDVSEKPQFYGPGGGYGFFAGTLLFEMHMLLN